MADTTDGTGTESDANTYRPFRQVREVLLSSLRALFDRTTPDSLSATTSMAGALSLALTYINKQNILASSAIPTNSTGAPDPSADTAPVLLTSRILILSVSGDLAHQYIPMMNTIFACQRLSIPIDIAKIAGDTVFLQQASDATKGTFMQLEHPRGLLQYLMMGFLPDATSRQHLISPTQVGVDFRAACFCHRKIVDMGYVCSICLSSKPSCSEWLSMKVDNRRLLTNTSLLCPTRGFNMLDLWHASVAWRLWQDSCRHSQEKEKEEGQGGRCSRLMHTITHCIQEGVRHPRASTSIL